jgi:hypothetical protein
MADAHESATMRYAVEIDARPVILSMYSRATEISAVT